MAHPPIEHEAFVLLLADRAGVSVPTLVAAGMTAYDDALLVTDRDSGTLSDLAADDVTDELLDAIWEQLANLRAAGLSNGRLDQTDIWLSADGEPVIAGFANAAIHASDAQLNEDVASLLVNTTLIVGPDRAIDTKVPEPQQLQRVTARSVISTGLAGFSLYSIVSALAGVGLDTITDTLADARWGLVILALGITQMMNVTDAVSAVAASPKRVPLGVTTVEQFSISYIDLVTPSTAGMIAMNARYFQKFGIAAVTATTVGAMTGIVELLAEMILVVVTVLVGAGSIDLSQLEADGSVLRVIGFALALFVIAFAVVYFVPKWRTAMSAKLKAPVAEIGHAIALLRDPKRFVLTFGGAITTEILFAGGLALCVLASGGSISLGEAIFINVVVSAFAGLMPVPGGVGVYEAGLVAGLTAIGVSNDIAVSATLIFRLLSFYLPPIWGYVALRWLKQRDYL
jgi:uncharacterized membrane protein YbhN (UPF0104 family)